MERMMVRWMWGVLLSSLRIESAVWIFCSLLGIQSVVKCGRLRWVPVEMWRWQEDLGVNDDMQPEWAIFRDMQRVLYEQTSNLGWCGGNGCFQKRFYDDGGGIEGQIILPIARPRSVWTFRKIWDSTVTKFSWSSLFFLVYSLHKTT